MLEFISVVLCFLQKTIFHCFPSHPLAHILFVCFSTSSNQFLKSLWGGIEKRVTCFYLGISPQSLILSTLTNYVNVLVRVSIAEMKHCNEK